MRALRDVLGLSPAPFPPMPKDSVVEFRCDCGSLIGYVFPAGAGLRMQMRTRAWHRKTWHSEEWPRDLTDLYDFGRVASCGRHDRLIIGDDWELPQGDGRRRVIVRRPPDE